MMKDDLRDFYGKEVLLVLKDGEGYVAGHGITHNSLFGYGTLSSSEIQERYSDESLIFDQLQYQNLESQANGRTIVNLESILSVSERK